MNPSGVKAVALFMDGTSNSKPPSADAVLRPGRDVTNVAVLSEWIPDSVPPGRAERYIRGVGADEANGRLNLRVHVRNAFGMLFGRGLSGRVREMYSRLCRYYRDGFSIFLFGFSRGACTARVLAGFVDEVGLLLESQLDLVEEAWSLYVRDGDVDASDLRDYLRKVRPDAARPSAENGNQLPIHFLGVWDTVAMWYAVNGVLFDPTQRLARFPSNVTHGRQAFAIHEVRPLFPELPWTTLHPSVPGPQSIRQVWFPGNHGDVGGGYAAGEDALSRHALAWMITEARAQGLSVSVPAADAHVDEHAPLIVHDQSHRYERPVWLVKWLSRGRWRRAVLKAVRQPTLVIRAGLSNGHRFEPALAESVSLDEGYIRWLLNGRAPAFVQGLPDDTVATMIRAEDAAVQLALRQPFERAGLTPPPWISDVTAATVRDSATWFRAFLTTPQAPVTTGIDVVAKRLVFQLLLQGAGFWDDVARTILEAVHVPELIANGPPELLEMWWGRLDAFKKVAALADADLPPSLKGKTTVDRLEDEVIKPVRDASIEDMVLRGSSPRARKASGG